MVHLEFKYSDKGETKSKKVSIPESWKEVTYEQYINVIKQTNNLDAICAITGLDKAIFDVQNSIDIYAELSKYMQWINTPLKTNKLESKVFYYKDQIIHLNKDLSRNKIAPYEDCKQLITNCYTFNEEKEEATLDETKLSETLPLICAIYLQLEIDKDYNIHKAKEIEKELYKESCINILEWGGFFLSTYLNMKTNFKNHSQKQNLTQFLKKLVMINS